MAKMPSWKATSKVQALYPDRTITGFRAGERLGYINVCSDVKGGVPHHFTFGQKLGEFVAKECPTDLEPILYLTEYDGQPYIQTEGDLFIAVVNFKHYRATANPDPARAYFAYRKGLPQIGFRDLDPEAITEGDMKPLLDELWSRPQIKAALISALVDLVSTEPSEHSSEHPDLSDPELDLFIAIAALVAKSPKAQAQLANDATKALQIPNLEGFADAIRMASRRKVVAKFEQQLDWQKHGLPKWSETEWEDFFELNPWLLGLGLREIEVLRTVQKQPTFAPKNIDGRRGQRGDIIASTDGAAKFTVVVALKTPEALLIQPESGKQESYRNRAHRVGEDVVGGVAQVQAECYYFDTGCFESRILDLENLRKIHTIRPMGILVVGNLDQFHPRAGAEPNEALLIRDKLTSFQLLRSSIQGVCIVTFDQVLARAQALLGGMGETDAPSDGNAKGTFPTPEDPSA